MWLDPWTLWVIVGLVALFSAGATFLAWSVSGRETGLAQWGAGNAFLALGVGALLLRDRDPQLAMVLFSNATLLIGYGLQWVALRSFGGRGSPLWWVAVPPALWCVVALVPPFNSSMHDRIGLFAAFVAMLNLAALREIWRASIPEPVLRSGLLVLTGTLLGLNLLRLVVVAMSPPAAIPLSIMSADGAIYGLIGMGLVVLATFLLVLLVREKALRQLREAAVRDDLTGLPNRRGFMAQAVPRCAAGGRLALLMFDLDRLKAINDTHGHAAGDRVLALFGEVVRARLVAGAVAGRLGGEEFALLLPGAEDATALASAERLRQAVREASMRLEHAGGVPAFLATVSIGIATLAEPAPGDGQERLERLYKAADVALYRAKRDGRDRVELGTIPATQPA